MDRKMLEGYGTNAGKLDSLSMLPWSAWKSWIEESVSMLYSSESNWEFHANCSLSFSPACGQHADTMRSLGMSFSPICCTCQNDISEIFNGAFGKLMQCL